jgi:hypothetical protein
VEGLRNHYAHWITWPVALGIIGRIKHFRFYLFGRGLQLLHRGGKVRLERGCNMTDPLDFRHDPAVVQVADEKIYIRALDEGASVEEIADNFLATQRTYCEKCKSAHPGSECPWCGREQGNGMFGGCIYCRTSYRAGRKNCPVCKVQTNLNKANTTTRVEKRLEHWQAAYDEARSNGYYFSINEHLAHAYYLIEAGRGNEASHILDHLFAYCGNRLSLGSRGLLDEAEYFSYLSHLEECMARKMMADEQQYRKEHGNQSPSLAIAYTVHAILSFLYYRTNLKINILLMPDIYNNISAETECLDKVNVKKMKRVLIDIKKNKQGRPEELCKVINKHLAIIPKIDMQELQQDVAALLVQW